MALPAFVPPRAQLDHIMVGIRSLYEGITQFERLTGVRPAVGGRHPGRGTENALVSLGAGAYLEIIAPRPGATLAPRDQPLLALDSLAIVGWVVSVPEVDGAVAALRSAGFSPSPAQPGARLTPAGERLDWTIFALSGEPGGAPFFIRWSPNSRHPSTTAPDGCSLDSLVVEDPESDRLSTAMRTLDVSRVTIASGSRRIEATLMSGSNRVTLTNRES